MWSYSITHLTFYRENFSAMTLVENMVLNKPNKLSQEQKEKDDNTFLNAHLISASVTESVITYKSSVDILLELSGVWIGREGGD